VYRTVTEHDLPGPRLVPVQVSAVLVNAAEPNSATDLIAPEDRDPLLTTVAKRHRTNRGNRNPAAPRNRNPAASAPSSRPQAT
jgi:hypothetical protein